MKSMDIIAHVYTCNIYVLTGSLRSAPPHSYPVVLVRGDGREAGLLKDKRFVVLLRVFLAVLAWVHVNHVKPWLVAVHWVENNLEKKIWSRIKRQHIFVRHNNSKRSGLTEKEKKKTA